MGSESRVKSGISQANHCQKRTFAKKGVLMGSESRVKSGISQANHCQNGSENPTKQWDIVLKPFAKLRLLPFLKVPTMG